ncbi:alginate export family protein [Aquimarina sp. 2201CG5-10]|uniref:alginate export family protein n=1 Tax=Aquimarina callyspongiae TaxID=3098150 RepID=UPI002AB3C817|nr:alginate export family protein [Aquimarina sp. 2201CG5-10]MDY8134339.1 alginate export family protein [Aquimarina sp. 2201CG5-10]
MKTHISYLLIILCIGITFSQEGNSNTKSKLPPFKVLRAEENYSYLNNKKKNPYEKDFFDPVKFIPLNKSKDAYLSFGGQLRSRFEHYSNRLWESQKDQDFYSQRINLHVNLVLGKYVRVFGELYHGYTSHEREFTEFDEIDFHQLFIDFKLPLQNDSRLLFRFGRQEMPFGAARLVGLREGPNIRRSFDAGRLIFKNEETNIQAFYAREVQPTFNAFDNKFTLFKNDAINPKLWGVYSQFKIRKFNGLNEVYYLGFQSDNARFNDVTGKETRHSIGIRRFGTSGKRWQYNTEVIFQFGEIGNSNINAFDIETDWHYKFINTPWQPRPGLKLQYTSGDKDTNDQKINTFNPMFVNPSYYSLALTITPVNLIGVHPSFSIQPTENLNLYLEWAFFWRASRNDGLYQPPRFVNRETNGVSNRNLGNQFGFKASYEISRHLSFDWDLSYFIAGDFQKATGESENILHFAPTLSYKF